MDVIFKVDECISSAIVVTEDGVRLPDVPAIAFKLSNWNVDDEPTFTRKSAPGIAPVDALNEVYWGFKGVYAHQLFESDETEIIPVKNLESVCLRSRPGQSVTIWFSYWQ